MKESELATAFLISGSGTTAEAAIRACQSGKLKRVKPMVVISSRADAKGLATAEALGIPTQVVARKNFPTAEAFGDYLIKLLKSFGVELVSQNGWTAWTPTNVIAQWEKFLVNQHPGPLDGQRLGFGGQGMVGARVVCARLGYEWVVGAEPAWTEATVHQVTPEYDQGDLISIMRMELPTLGRSVSVADLRTDPRELMEISLRAQKQLLPLEHENVIQALSLFAEGRVQPFQRPEPLIPLGYELALQQMKDLAIELFPGV